MYSGNTKRDWDRMVYAEEWRNWAAFKLAAKKATLATEKALSESQAAEAKQILDELDAKYHFRDERMARTEQQLGIGDES